jgi:MoxR-like ATPase
MTLTITGLTPQQRILCDVIWACESREQVEAFVRSLPRAVKQQAELMVEMMTLAVYDEINSIDPEVQKLLTQF